jgi:arylsulfatase A
MSDQAAIISRRQFLQASIVGTAAVMGLAGLERVRAETQRLPNFVFILVDDLGYQDLGCFGSPLIKTPRVDRMAAEGVKFTSYYAQTVCTPSRAALMTGCYPMRVGLPNVLGPDAKIGINSSEITLAELLKSRGYATTCIGKWHLGHHPQFLPTHHGFDSYFGLPYSNDMGKQVPVPLIRGEKIIEQPANQDTLTQRYTQEAVKFIEANKDRPFFLYLPHTMVHVPLHVSDKFRGKSKRGLYGDATEEIDWSTGEILDTLKRLGLDDNTLVVFTSDNGPWLIQKQNGGSALPLRDGKGTTYDGGVRVPCVVRWPGKIPAGGACGEMVTEMDILPTFARLAKAAVPTDRIIDGKDIWPLLSGAKGAVTPHENLFFYRANRLQAMRSGKWKLILPQDGAPAALYDIDADIGETKDLAGSHPSVVTRLSAMAEKCREDLGDAITGRVGKNCRKPGKVI